MTIEREMGCACGAIPEYADGRYTCPTCGAIERGAMVETGRTRARQFEIGRYPVAASWREVRR